MVQAVYLWVFLEVQHLLVLVFDTNGNKCLVSTICMQVGLGAFGGVGGNLSGGYDKHLITGRSQNWGFFINGGKGLAGG